MLVGLDINSFIPYPYNIDHGKHIKKFVKLSKTSYIKFPAHLFLSDYFGFLVECQIEIKSAVRKDESYFLVKIIQLDLDREIALM